MWVVHGVCFYWNILELEVQQCDGRVHTSQQNQEVPSTNPYPLQMLKESLCNLVLSGSQSHALSITHRNSMFQLKGCPGLSSQINFLTCETRIKGLIDIKAFKIHCLSANCYFPCDNQKLILCVCVFIFHSRNSSHPRGTRTAQNGEKQTRDGSLCQRGIRSLQ